MVGLDGNVFVIHRDQESQSSVAAIASSLGLEAELFFSAEAFLARFTPSLAGCLVADLGCTRAGALDLQTALAARGSLLPIIFLSARPDVAAIVRAMKNGALTVLSIPFRAEELVKSVLCALEINSKSREVAAWRAEVQKRLESLTAQERQVLEMVVAGMPNKRITRVFGVSQRTVARVRARVYEKMCVESAFDLARVIAISGALPEIGNQDHSLSGGNESGGIASGAEACARILPPPHFQHDLRRQSSGEFDHEHSEESI